MQPPEGPQARPPSPAATAAGRPPALVLDTNAVLDWLWFADPAMQAVGAAIAGGRCRWWATPAMADELAHVLARGLRPRPGADRAAVLDGWRRWAHLADAPAGPAPPGLRCRDADDQKFVDLAVGIGASWLVTRDRALLALASAASRNGLAIVPPAGCAAAET